MSQLSLLAGMEVRWMVIMASVLSWCGASNVLVLTPVTSHSHTNFFVPVVEALGNRGHSVTYWTGLKPRRPMANVTQLYSVQLHQHNRSHLFLSFLSSFATSIEK